MRLLVVTLCGALVACGGTKKPPPPIELIHRTGLPQTHLATCDDPACGDGENPPVGGKHCATPLACRVFDVAQPRCQWVHNLEHGHAVLAYNCPTGCADIVAVLSAVRDAQRANGNSRVVVVPDPALPKRVAAIVWGWGWVGDDANSEAIAAVLSHEDVDAPEAGLPCAQ